MSRVDDLISRLVPYGVQLMTLGEVLRIRNGKDHKALGEGDIPVYGSGGIMRYVDTAAAKGPSVLIPRKGSLGNIFYVEGPFWVVDTIFRTEIRTDLIEPKFLYHQLLTMGLGDMNQAGGVPSQTQTVLNSLRIPVPPLEVQREIVRILDQFTQLEAELEAELKAELEARRVQYEHYRTRILGDAQSGVDAIPIGELGLVITGRTPKATDTSAWGSELDFITPTDIKNGLRVISEPARRLSAEGAAVMAKVLIPAGSVLVTCIGADMGKTVINGNKCVTNQQVNAVILNPGVHVGYLFHVLTSMRDQIRAQGERGGGTMPIINKSDFSKIQVRIPPLSVQEATASKLDQFDALVNDLAVGLPAELRARRQQYEYYRDKLLTFKETG